ncbi:MULTISPECIES: adenylate/guanylate cyclase domain-containing protein [unclassified Mesorhizobium]|uniref:adenylate/guanylate cyclase domain-containing protein n=1 Tax=unclassified Mesorhizobium TaxID=325217 RepID=UPI000FCCBD63|nr:MULTISPECIES: adenylate/guanylate cyclase domain-containing protein [unclassified Mesorhizobium]TIT79965.1 MAG: tetratricopeptide repeat protein [Mesorhizobium sp.]TGP23995.1 adenylate/guanylate cyclase domain-containing protein [Mesorhizobium sp. M1D.F.Ca.ET.231.01.1.1]TGP35418.1 adenylate/guanylate cyclase domain-containing protein [Mesorhizobium sp. M1D.F.Ca.ET.234.01.1.1]TGS49441.1 adenylate/guanylate cyclase domain-containing protein [Mesorhizobium sp. M1D.F.Ca.ET.184.01.1.1]TGS63637.1
MERRLTAIFAADVVGYSRLMGLDEVGTLAALKAHRREMADGRIAEHHGRIVKLTGDGMLVEFPSVVNAVACAAEIQRAMRERNAGVPAESRIEFRIGIHLGDIIVEDNDIYGDGVNVAARIESIARPGGVAVSGSVRDNVGNRLDLAFEDAGEQVLKNIDRPVRVYHVDLFAGIGQPRSSTVSVELEAEPAAGEKPSIAVLPFNNMSGDPEQEYFADGITEDIITDLSKISGLFVIGRNNVFTYKGRVVKLQQVAAELGVRYLLEGSVRKAAQRVRVTGQLIDGKSGGHVWADRYDRDLTDIFAIQDEITHTIVDQLKVRLLPEEKQAIRQAPTENVEAYTYYLRGREFVHRGSKSYYLLARRMFAKAIELDPLYARAYAGIADCDSFLFLHYDVKVSLEAILANSARALDIDPSLGEAHASRGLALSVGERYQEAEAEYEKAIAGNPNLFEAHYFYARTCQAQGKFEKASEHFARAAELNPTDYQSMLLLVQIYRSLALRDKELWAAREGLERAKRVLEKHPENPRPAYMGANALVVLGDRERAREWAARALAIDPDDILTRYNIACVRCLLGDFDEAFALLEDLLPHANHETKAWVRYDSDFATLHGLPRWQKVLELAR